MGAQVYRPIDVLEKQVEQINFWQRHPHRLSYDKTFQHLMVGAKIADGQPGAGRQIVFSHFLGDRYNKAETIYVRSNIISRLWDFTDVYETHEHETIQPEDPPVDHGFAYFEHNIHIIDGQGKVNSIRAILWSVEENGVSVVLFSDPRDPLDDINHEQVKRFGEDWNADLGCDLPPFHIMNYPWGKKIQNLTIEDYSFPPQWDPDQDDAERHARYRKHAKDNVEYQNRFNNFLISLWEFMGEQVPMRMSPDRPMRKRLQRAHSPLSEVSIIQLRPYDRGPAFNDPDHVPQTVMWNSRWRVREHKRRWIDKHGNYRETTVSAHIKGPEHLPLIEKDRVFHVKR